MTTLFRSADERRREIQTHAASIGIDEDYISTLVDSFYARVRADETLGPIFEAEIGDGWAHHLARMKDFWASVAMNAGRYSGQPVPAHQKLAQVHIGHFAIWLRLFRETLSETAPSTEAVVYFLERAERIARSLQMAMFGETLTGGAPNLQG
ncbi:MAG: group III truncated hemoglobin [Neomegalonema sp.]|nr:group III truncated hemoglobin [Neomegalonema sp.]